MKKTCARCRHARRMGTTGEAVCARKIENGIGTGVVRLDGIAGCTWFALSAKAYLLKAAWMEDRAQDMTEQAARYKDAAIRITSIGGGMPKGGKGGSRVERNACGFFDMARSIEAMADALMGQLREAYAMLEEIGDEEERAVLRKRYMARKAWQEIADAMNYDVRQVHRIHGKALRSYQQAMDERGVGEP